MEKCQIFVFGGSNKEQLSTKSYAKAISPTVTPLSSVELMILGAPVLPEAVPAVLQEKTRQGEPMASRQGKLAAHQALFLLKNCLFLPKLYVLRCSPVWKFPSLLRDFDDVIRCSAAKITNTNMTDRSRNKQAFQSQKVDLASAEQKKLPSRPI
ncbi:hypothetical protein RvY_17031 [Ramazzottius varieornatus]|uniref:Uncharacterized protein n=1 Tax=Ramazzottius varieornatus TaxID=947166 RepID=A0A1D1W1L3_RAMVA|nr:hypothetical protein RvY_17031 [Ramazzottius varieornatus]